MPPFTKIGFSKEKIPPRLFKQILSKLIFSYRFHAISDLWLSPSIDKYCQYRQNTVKYSRIQQNNVKCCQKQSNIVIYCQNTTTNFLVKMSHVAFLCTSDVHISVSRYDAVTGQCSKNKTVGGDKSWIWVLCSLSLVIREVALSSIARWGVRAAQLSQNSIHFNSHDYIF